MIFVSAKYLVFLSVVFLVYWNLGRRRQNLFLLAASYFFYANWDWRFLSLIIISTGVDYVSGARIFQASTRARKTAWLWLSLVVNLGILGFFKYFGFFADSLVELGRAVGWRVSSPTLHIILPVGISFYTFQTMSYSLDIYRGQLKPTKSFVDFAAFVAFFPQLVAGPIVRAKEFIFQLEKDRRFSGRDFEAGLIRILFGFFKKAFIADTLGVYLVDPVFAHPALYSSATLWLAIVGYAVQVYADFSGYSNMAIGSARILGFRIPENFLFPFLSTNFSEFWRRWHMTMSRFFRDYIYIALGGNRRGTPRTLRNIAVTTLLAGLWHGAAWTYVLWGGLQGAYIAVYHLWRIAKERLGWAAEKPGFARLLPAWLLTQLCFCVSLIPFRSRDFGSSWVYVKGLLHSSDGVLQNVPLVVWIAFAALLVDHTAGWIHEHRPELRSRVPVYAQSLAYCAAIVFMYAAIPEKADPFIYFQF